MPLPYAYIREILQVLTIPYNSRVTENHKISPFCGLGRAQ